MRMQFKVKYSDGREVEAVAKPKDVVEYERHYKTSFLSFGQGSPMEHLYWLAWCPLHRAGQDTRDFDAFMSDVDEIETVEESAPVPFETAPSEG